jgi:hypothetical protein
MQLSYERPLVGEAAKPIAIQAAKSVDVPYDTWLLITGFLHQE